MRHTFPFLPVLSMLVLSCNTPRMTSHTDTTQPSLAKEQTWQLAATKGRNLAPGDKAPTLVINPEAGTFTGHAQCNSYTFRYVLQHPEAQLDGDYYDLGLSFWGSSTLTCPEASKNAEERYLDLLSKSTRIRITSTTLTLYQQNKETLHFELQ